MRNCFPITNIDGSIYTKENYLLSVQVSIWYVAKSCYIEFVLKWEIINATLPINQEQGLLVSKQFSLNCVLPRIKTDLSRTDLFFIILSGIQTYEINLTFTPFNLTFLP